MIVGRLRVGGREVSCTEGVCPDSVDGRRWEVRSADYSFFVASLSMVAQCSHY